MSQPNNGVLGYRLIHQLSFVGIADILRSDTQRLEQSKGGPSKRVLYPDIDAATGDLGYAPSDVVLFDFSLGTAMSMGPAARRRRLLAGVVLIALFASVLRFSTALEKGKTCYMYQIASVDKVGAIVTPIITRHSGKDNVVLSVKRGHTLFNNRTPPSRSRSNADHETSN